MMLVTKAIRSEVVRYCWSISGVLRSLRSLSLKQGGDGLGALS